MGLEVPMPKKPRLVSVRSVVVAQSPVEEAMLRNVVITGVVVGDARKETRLVGL